MSGSAVETKSVVSGKPAILGKTSSKGNGLMNKRATSCSTTRTLFNTIDAGMRASGDKKRGLREAGDIGQDVIERKWVDEQEGHVVLDDADIVQHHRCRDASIGRQKAWSPGSRRYWARRHRKEMG